MCHPCAAAFNGNKISTLLTRWRGVSFPPARNHKIEKTMSTLLPMQTRLAAPGRARPRRQFRIPKPSPEWCTEPAGPAGPGTAVRQAALGAEDALGIMQ